MGHPFGNKPIKILGCLLLILFTIISAAFAGRMVWDRSRQKENHPARPTLSTLFQCFSQTEWRIEETNLHAWGRLERNMSQEDMETVREQIGNWLSERIQGSPAFEGWDTRIRKSASSISDLYCISGGDPVFPINITVRLLPVDSGQTYLIADVMSKPENISNLIRKPDVDMISRKLDTIEAFVNDSFRSLGVKPIVSAYVHGTYPGKLDNESKDQFQKSLFDQLQAKQTGSITEGSLLSINGYTPLLEEWVTDGGHKVNINLAVRYNPSGNQMLAWLGSPVLSVEY